MWGYVREATMASRVQTMKRRQSTQGAPIGFNWQGWPTMGESRAGFLSKHLLSTNNVVGTTLGYGDTEINKDMNLCLWILALLSAVTGPSRNKLYNHRILDSNPCAAIARWVTYLVKQPIPSFLYCNAEIVVIVHKIVGSTNYIKYIK